MLFIALAGQAFFFLSWKKNQKHDDFIFKIKSPIHNAAALGMKHKLHGTTPIEHFRVPLDALTRQTDFRQLGNVFAFPLHKHFQPRCFSLWCGGKVTLFRLRFYII